MLNRQKVLLEMVQSAGRPVSHFELTKWSFLLRHESDTQGGSAFFDFLPYRYGPFSFCLYQEATKLTDQGYLIATDENHWQIGNQTPECGSQIASDVRDSVSQIVSDFSRRTKKQLTDYVYEKYGWFTINSELRKVQRRQETSPAVFTIGYEGLSVDAFLNRLMVDGVRRIIDVRSNPIARRYGFHKSTLQRLANYVGIDYQHQPTLGISPQERKDVTSKLQYDALFRRYEFKTLKQQSIAVESVSKSIAKTPSTLLCMERDPACCHRSRLANKLSQISGLPIKHLTSND